TIIGRQFFQAPGGKGANQAVAAARAGGAPLLFIAAVGDDEFGRAATDHLSRERLLLDYVTRIEDTPSGVAMILVDDDGENCIAVTPGANACLLPGHVDRVPDEEFGAARVLLASLEVPLATVRRGLERAKMLGLSAILNPAPMSNRQAVLDLLPLVDVLTPNEHEAAQLLDHPFRGLQQSLAAAEELRSLGCLNVIITLGAEGAVIASPAGTSHLSAFPVSAVDTTAAGDAFSGALATALAEQLALLDAARFASAAGALAVTRAGAQPSLPTRLAIEEMLTRHAGNI
ncbi:MAG TPA: ribokinase, partial [Pirellulaceae bacterium]|nr:ribokinase [Pirellulaceae bacterium]